MAIFKGLALSDIYRECSDSEVLGGKEKSRIPPSMFERQPYPSVREEPVKTLERLWPEGSMARINLYRERWPVRREPHGYQKPFGIATRYS